MMHRAWCSTEEVPHCLSRSSIKFQGHTGQKRQQFSPKLGVSRLWLQLEFTDGLEILDKSWHSIEEVPYCFQGHPFNFKVTRDKKCRFYPIRAFPDWNSCLMALKRYTELEVALKRCPIVFSRPSVKFQGYIGQKNADFDPNWAFPDCNSSQNTLRVLK